jgi:hypothetical protein
MMSHVARFGSLTLLLIVVLSAFRVAPTVDAEDMGDATPEEIETYLSHDLELIAKANNWTPQEARIYYEASVAVGDLAEQVAERWPDQFVGSSLAATPEGKPTLYLKGEASRALLELVGKSGVEVAIDEGQPYSRQELEKRSQDIHRALVALGYRNVSSGPDITSHGGISAFVAAQSGLESNSDAILALLPHDLRHDLTLTVSASLNGGDKDAFGGMKIRDDGTPVCTSGFSVFRLSDGVGGVTTAGHCPNAALNEIVHPGHGVHALTNFRGQHLGQWGDVQWHSSDQFEPDDFLVTGIARDVSAVEGIANIAVNEAVCFMTIFSPNPHEDCSARVAQPSWNCTNDGVTTYQLVLMNKEVADFGDSGGPWYIATRAYGGEKGTCQTGPQNQELFTAADYFDEALGVRVKVSPWQ